MLASTLVLAFLIACEARPARLSGTLASGLWEEVARAPTGTTRGVLSADGYIVSYHGGSGSPKRLTNVLEYDRTTIRVRTVDDLRKYAGSIASFEQANEYAELLREFEIPRSEVPGLPMGRQDRGGLHPAFAEMVLEFGIDHVDAVGQDERGFTLRRVVVEFDGSGPTLELLEERVTKDGAYSFRRVRTVARGSRVIPLIVPSY